MPSLFPFNCFFFYAVPWALQRKKFLWYWILFLVCRVNTLCQALSRGYRTEKCVCVCVCVCYRTKVCVCVCVYVCYRTKVYAFPGLWLARFFFPRVTGLRLASEAHVLLVVSWTKHIVTDRTTCGIGSTCTCVWTALPPLLTAGLGFRV